MFTFMLTFNILLVVVLGGIGSITGSVVSALGVTILMEALRFLDGPLDFLVFQTEGAPGLRMVVFSAMLMAVVLFRQRGLMGNRELSWRMLAKVGLLPRAAAGEEARKC
jgi:branched-chain amino acid transport system permease protein